MEQSGFQSSIPEFHIVVILAFALRPTEIVVPEIIILEIALHNRLEFGFS